MSRESLVILRSLLQQPTFTLTTVGTLALGIAASIALFSTVDAVLLRPLPYPNPEDIYTVRTTITDGRYTSGLVATEELAELQQRSEAVSYATGAIPVASTFLTESGPVSANGFAVWRDFFELFGVPMTLGRGFSPGEHTPPGEALVVLSHGTWRTHFGGDPDIVGKSIRIPGRSLLVVGVAAASFDVPAGSNFWVNLRRGADLIGHELYGYLRLRPGSTPEALRGPMTQVMQDLAVKYPDQNKNRIFVLTPMLDAVVGELGSILIVVFGATALLLALTCLNVTNLLLARAAVRMREMAVRTALGASRWHIVRYSLIESLLLAAAGGILGLAGAYAGLELLLAFGASELPRLDTVTFDRHVWLFAFGTTLATGAVVGAVPAMRISDTDPSAVMNEEGRSGTVSTRTRSLLATVVTLEVAIGVALVASTGFMVRSYANLRGVDAGFSFEDRSIVDVLLPDRYANPERYQQWYAAVIEGMRTRGGTGVAAASSLPLRPERDTTTFVDIVSQPATDPHQRPNARLRVVSPGFFSVMGTQLLAGRDFSETDSHDSQAVAIVSEAFVRRFLGKRDPLRETLRVPGFRARRTERGVTFEEVAIVGVVADVRHAALHLPAEQTVYLTPAQRPLLRTSLIVSAPPGRFENMQREVRSVLGAADPEVSIELSSVSQVLASALSRHRAGMLLMLLFGLAAVVLLAVGVLGVVGYMVAQRRREIAIRLALGAKAPQIIRGVVGESARVAAVGAAIGLVFAWWTGTTVAAYVHNLRAVEPGIWGISVLVVLAVSLGATLVAARRVAAVDPATTLRSS